MNYYNSECGRIEVVCGPMFAGKTEEIIRRITRMEYAKKNFIVFKPLIDNRYSNDEVVSHSKYKKKAINIASSKDILKYITDDIQAVVIDEVQFFDDGVVAIAQQLADEGLRVICAGLDLDFKGKPFGVIPQLLAVAERVTKLTAICVCCGEEATRTQRIINGKEAYEDDPVVLVGANESYESRCRSCHKVLKRD